MIIGIDVDEVLANTLDVFFEFHNDLYGTHANKNQMKSYYLMDILGGTHAEILEKWEEFYKSDYFYRIQPVNGAAKAISTLQYNHTLYIITARPEHTREMTELWVKNCIDEKCPQIYFANSEGGKKKSEVCKELGVELHIDDSFEFGLDCVENDVRVLLMDGPWNRHETLVSGMTRVHSWDEVLANIEQPQNS
jgi:uncharacterized HAD superfamily protein